MACSFATAGHRGLMSSIGVLRRSPMVGTLTHVHARPAGRCWPVSRLCNQRFGMFRTAAAANAEQVGAQVDGQAGLSTIAGSAMSWPSRTHGAGTLREADAGKQITICGWVDRNRNLGGLGFLDVRDHTGLLQVGDRQSRLTSGASMLRRRPYGTMNGANLIT